MGFVILSIAMGRTDAMGLVLTNVSNACQLSVLMLIQMLASTHDLNALQLAFANNCSLTAWGPACLTTKHDVYVYSL